MIRAAWLLPLLITSAAAPVAAAPVDYQLTPTHSFVHFDWLHAGLSTLRGRFDKVSGRVSMDRAAHQGQGRIELRLDSVNTGRPVLDAALRQALRQAAGAAATLDEAIAHITLDSLRFDGEVPAAAQGRLRWRGGELPLTLKTVHFNCYLNPLLRREVCGGEFETSVEPATLGLVLDPAFGLAGPILLRIQVEALRQEQGS